MERNYITVFFPALKIFEAWSPLKDSVFSIARVIVLTSISAEINYDLVLESRLTRLENSTDAWSCPKFYLDDVLAVGM